jgi:hypothetical protein
MRDLPLEISGLPASVAARLPRKATSVREAEICVDITLDKCGVRAALYVAHEVYVIPVQFWGECDIADIIWLCNYEVGEEGWFTKKADERNSTESSVGTYRYQKNNTKLKRGSETFSAELVKTFGATSRGSRVLPKLAKVGKSYTFSELSTGCWWGTKVDSDTNVFPKKKNKGVVKQNLRFDHVWEDVRCRFPDVAYVCGKNREILEGMYNDEAVSWLIWLCAVTPIVGDSAYAFVATYALNAKFLKSLNTKIKALGLQSTSWGCYYCELTTMAGRGMGIESPEEDIQTRVDLADFKRIKAADCDINRLKKCIAEILKRELTVKPVWGSVDSYWSRRWIYTKSGAHSRFVEKDRFGERFDLPERPTRREFAEVCKENILGKTKCRVDAGHSYKEEHGKTRHIYSCDTITYYNFDYLLRPIEKVWRNKNVLLDPGRELQSSRYGKYAEKSSYKYMIDFDDFNSQHTIAAMKAVIELATEGAPPEVREWAIGSWDNIFYHWLDGEGEMQVRKSCGTLPSGHRATTFINTVLNAAYCMYANEEVYSKLESYHCGDDVVMFGKERDISDYVVAVAESPFRINPAKQSVGSRTGEFLRVSFNETEARGYGARGISSMVSGNWVTETLLDKKSYVETLLRGLWTVCTRFSHTGLGLVALTSLRYRVPEVAHIAFLLVTHKLSWDGTPCSGHRRGDPVHIVRPVGGLAKYDVEELTEYHATKDFMREHIDYKMLEVSGYTPESLFGIMKRASMKPRYLRETTPLTYEIEESNAWYITRFSSLALLHERADMSRDQALNVLQLMLNKVEWYKLVGLVRNVVPSAFGTTGKSPWPLLAAYDAPMSDLMSLRQRVSCTTHAVVEYPVRV